MAEFRKDVLNNTWVIIAPERAKRPMDLLSNPSFETVSVEESKDCPFCPGNELMTPPEVLAYRQPGTGSNQEGWTVRVVRNKFPAVEPNLEITSDHSDIYERQSAFGYHEVVIETPSHSKDFAKMTVEQISDIVWAWRDRLLSLRADQRIKYALVFKNRGRMAGASLAHPHSQIIATPMVPKKLEEELEQMMQFYDATQECLICHMISLERGSGTRVIYENDDFVAFCPYASFSAYQIMIVPKLHMAEFIDMDDIQVTNLASAIRSVFYKLYKIAGDVAYNLWLHNEPWHDRTPEAVFHWHIDIVPKLAQFAGFEVGSGFYINHTSPEDAASILRSAKVEE
jgi:UDPglucose--hexose-1-phosphate uridylyltransferase